MPVPPSETPASATPPAPARVVGFLAAAAPKAVLLRRGPSDWFQLIAWDTATDRFEDGQWFRGMVYDYASDLSPDGTLFLYGAAKYYVKPDPTYTDKWTAISHPPYYTALALWPQGQVVPALGGYFRDNSTVLLNTFVAPHPDHPPHGLRVLANTDQRDGLLGSGEQRLVRAGWHLRQKGEWQARKGFVPARIWERANAQAHARLLLINTRWRPYRFAMLQGADPNPRPLDGVTWADWDQQGRLVFARAGKLFACQVMGGTVQETELVDFNDRQPDPTPAPAWATTW